MAERMTTSQRSARLSGTRPVGVMHETERVFGSEKTTGFDMNSC
jgi:hypothetical protein